MPPPRWLFKDAQVYSPKLGFGVVTVLLGPRLLITFRDRAEPLQVADWSEAIATGFLQPPTAASQRLEAVDTVSMAEIPGTAFGAIAQSCRDTLVAVEVAPAVAGDCAPLPPDLPFELQQALQQTGITQLYGHQIEALRALREGQDLCLATPTASGKTLCYTPAILESCLTPNLAADLAPKPSSALFLFPLKALAFDQMSKLSRLIAALPFACRPKLGIITGDTPRAERQQLFEPQPPQLLAVSPDLLHYQLYRGRLTLDGESWRAYLRQLRWVVIDEAHTYIGAFGAHFANLMRRLRLAVDSAGGNSDRLQFISASATIGNPGEMALRFSGRSAPEKLHVIEHSQAGTASRTLLCLAPSSAANPDSCRIILSWLQQGLSGLVFCNSRAAVKNLKNLIQQEFSRQGVEKLAQQVAIFYGSLSAQQRQQIITQLGSGETKVILTTSALEAGIDLPELDCCLIRGYPGSLMSFRQRIGRVGRRHPGLVMFLPVAQNVLDNFYGENTSELLHGQVESAAFNPNYPTILSQHLCCGAVESSLFATEVEQRFGPAANILANSLLQQKQLRLYSSGCLSSQGYPHRSVNLRGTAQSAIALIDTASGQVFESMNRDLACREVYPGAVYMAQVKDGELVSYLSEALDLEAAAARLKPLPPESKQFTRSEIALQIKVLEPLAEPKLVETTFLEGRLRLTLAWGKISSLVTGFTLFERRYTLTCVHKGCISYHRPLQGKTCPRCHHALQVREITQPKETTRFEVPYQTQYQTPVLAVEINAGLAQALTHSVRALREQIKGGLDELSLEQLDPIWEKAPEFVSLHSLGHQLIFAVPLVVLSSQHDVNWVVLPEGKRQVGYFFDTTEGGNGAVEAIFEQFPRFVERAVSLAKACRCQSGCPRCLHQHGCPQENAGLHKEAGLVLAEAIVGQCQSREAGA
ncbi:MAG: DEAD/DEAH box helicase [Leptolyngbyaceae cyanobacterium RM1_1_2]|nr:DEAD/DEAH box helicase [Leptolyngbyaceae cyanobacterium RM1_1_2]